MNKIISIKSKITGWLRLLTLEFITAAIVFMAAVLLFATIAHEMIVEKETAFDTRVFDFVSSYTSPAMTKAMVYITFLGTGFFLIPVYLCFILWFIKRKNFRYAIMVAVVALVSMLSGFILKGVFHRARPLSPLVSATGYSFPSGHSLAGFTFSGLMMYLTWHSSLPAYLKWIISVALCLLGCCIGLSRIYLHVHFASDVAGSLFITIAWLSVSFMIFGSMNKPLR